VWNPDWREKAVPPQTKIGVCLYKTVFPELIISDRDIKDDNDDVIFKVNQLLLEGMISDAAVFRCRATIASAPLYMDYLGKANALRERCRPILLEGVFSASKYHTVSAPGVQTNSFLRGGRLAVLLTQAWKDELRTKVAAPGYRLSELTSVRGDVSADESGNICLPRDSFAVLIFEKQSSIK
jgi:hypothetical protein